MTEAELMAMATALQQAALDLARGEAISDVLDAHIQAVREGRRLLIVHIAASRSRLHLSAFTIPADAHSDAEAMTILDLHERRVTSDG